MKALTLIVCMLLIISCGSGSPSVTYSPPPSCTVTNDSTGATIKCPDGSTSFVPNGSQGPTGATGSPGIQGPPGPTSPTTTVVTTTTSHPTTTLVTTTTTLPKVVYMGCYTDTPTRALSNELFSQTTIDHCINTAKKYGYMYAGLQYGSQCFAGNTLGYVKVNDSDCNMPCVLNHNKICGGYWRNSIYFTGVVK